MRWNGTYLNFDIHTQKIIINELKIIKRIRIIKFRNNSKSEITIYPLIINN
mgnify:CR=1 FL=1